MYKTTDTPMEEEQRTVVVLKVEKWYEISVWNLFKFLCKLWLAQMIFLIPVIIFFVLAYIDNYNSRLHFH